MGHAYGTTETSEKSNRFPATIVDGSVYAKLYVCFRENQNCCEFESTLVCMDGALLLYRIEWNPALRTVFTDTRFYRQQFSWPRSMHFV